MSSVSSASSYYIESLDMTLEELSEIEDLEGFYQSLIEGMTEEEISELESTIKSAFEEADANIYVIENQLNDIINASGSDSEEGLLAEFYLDKLSSLSTVIDEFSNSWGNAAEDVLALTIDATNGVDYTFESPENPEAGAEYVISTPETSEEDDSSSSLWSDSSDASISDNNYDGSIDAQDEVYDNQTITIELEEGDTIEWRSTDPETGDTRFYVQKADGTEYYITIENLTSNPDLDVVLAGSSGGLTSEIIAGWPEELQKCFYDSSSHHSEGISTYDFIHDNGGNGISANGVDAVTYNLDELSVDEITLEPSEADFEAGSEITIEMDEENAETINFVFPEDADVDFSYESSSKTLTITVTDSEGNKVTYKLENIDYGTSEETMDRINISGGVISTDDITDALAYTTDNDYNRILSKIIYHNGSSSSIYDTSSAYSSENTSSSSGININESFNETILENLGEVTRKRSSRDS